MGMVIHGKRNVMCVFLLDGRGGWCFFWFGFVLFFLWMGVVVVVLGVGI